MTVLAEVRSHQRCVCLGEAQNRRCQKVKKHLCSGDGKRPARTTSGVDSTPQGKAYRLRSGDAVVIYLRGIPQERSLDLVIDEHGTVSLPYLRRPCHGGRVD